MFKPLEVIGPEHEYSIVDSDLKPLPIVDQVIKNLYGRVVNNVAFKFHTFGKELQSHVAEIKANEPFSSPKIFEEKMHRAVLETSDFIERGWNAHLLGTGMHPLLRLDETAVWNHRDRKIYNALNQIFNLQQHGWLNIQSFQLNLSYGNESACVKIYNVLTSLLPYIAAISASSPICESKVSGYNDTRLYFYSINQREIPSITGNIIPKYITSFQDYRRKTVHRYTEDLKRVNAPANILNREWMNSRGVIIRFSRRALEVRIMDEQECIKADVAISCFVRACTRGLLSSEEELQPRTILINNLGAVMKEGLNASVNHPRGSTARDVCRYYLRMASANASAEEKSYLPTIKKRVEEGNLSTIIGRSVIRRARKTSNLEAIMNTYQNLVRCLEENRLFSEI